MSPLATQAMSARALRYGETNPTRSEEEFVEEPWFLVDSIHRKVFLIEGTLGSRAFGRVMAAQLMVDLRPEDVDSIAEEDPLLFPGRTTACAIKVMHKDMLYRHPDGRYGVRNEEKALQRVTMSGVGFLAKVWATWDDDDNVYLVMVSTSGVLRGSYRE